MLSKFLDPKNDFAFKKIFGNEKNKDILIHFLNDVIEFNGSPIRDVAFLKTIQDGETQEKKTSIVDVLCVDDNGQRYVVEMQVAQEAGFEKRAQYYASKAYCSQMKAGQKFHMLKAVIFLAIANFTMFREKEAYKSDHVILDKETHEHNLKDFSFTFLELPKFNKSIDQLENIIEMWMYFFKHAPETSPEDLDKLAEHGQIIYRVYEELNQCAWTEEELRTYDQREKYEKCYEASLLYAKGEGKEEGRAEGKIEGKAEERAAIAKKLLLRGGLPIEMIQETTGLSKEEISALQAEFLVPLAQAYQLDPSKQSTKVAGP